MKPNEHNRSIYMTDYESWYQQQVDAGRLPDKDGYYHYAQSLSDYCEMLADFLTEYSND